MGCVDPVVDQGSGIARTEVLKAGYVETVPGVQVKRICALRLEACANAAGKIASGEAGLVVAGSVEMMRRVPVLADRGIAIARKSVLQGIPADLIASLRG
ncbi:hypothetical protein Q4543_22000 [Salipiger sp. 1_MG-2023]|uniref:thiolase family protein n=1 Tax=Salipiger sp. 1_MG-2023 TaxID=3062665 RepID=UPI0026E495A8|nr:hypothetical protein [Salipiger sp. 1_MG-2023]MDO6588175.1 hypothetical protein [Salipiger sp. 1_MG-2023]